MMTWQEIAAVGLALLYVVLAIRERRSCWIAGAASAAIYIWIFFAARLYMEALLQLFYIAMSVYGWLVWGRDDASDHLPIQRWPWPWHGGLILLVLALSTLLAAGLSRYTDAALPWLDSLTTVAAMTSTWLVARKVLENWLWWIAIDALSIYLYLSRDLHLTAALFGAYILLAGAGFMEWRKHYRYQQPISELTQP